MGGGFGILKEEAGGIRWGMLSPMRRWWAAAWLAAGFSRAVLAEAVEPEVLPGTTALTMAGDLSKEMHDAAERLMDRRMTESVAGRGQYWHRDLASPAAYAASVAANRERLAKLVGVVEARMTPASLEVFGEAGGASLVVETPAYRVQQVRWAVLPGVTGEGLWLSPTRAPRGYVVALPEADQTPEQITGLAAGVPEEQQYARRLVENGFSVFVPVMIDRGTAASGRADLVQTNEPHREWLHRQAYMMGRHIIGYEVQKVGALLDWIQTKEGLAGREHVGVFGYGEGGLVALYAGALDTRVQAVGVSGYFGPREETWREPLYRNVWGILREFGDAEVASLIAPRALVVERSAAPKVDGPPPVQAGQKECAAPGVLWTPTAAEVRREWARLEGLVPADLQTRALVMGVGEEEVGPGSEEALVKFMAALGFAGPLVPPGAAPTDSRKVDVAARQVRQVKEIEEHVQRLVRESDKVRDEFFLLQAEPAFRDAKWTYAQFPPRDPAGFVERGKTFREKFWKEVIGKIEEPLPAPEPQTRKIYEREKWTGYEVVLQTGEGGFTWGTLLVPHGLKPGEKRPVVVCQHGRRGRPAEVIDAGKEAYHDFAARLADEGFVVLAPHNLYGQEPQYRTISRKGNTVGLSMFSLILRHHQQWLRWLGELPFVDAQRIAFYGLSYGGESAVRVPPVLEGYCLSICSGDFNDWTRKVASTDDVHSFMFSNEWEMPYFNMGQTFSYAELSYLMFPRPFMVERGHHDGVAPDKWVAAEYAKTRWLYDQFGMGERTRIEFFNGGHTINGKGTFEFLREQLKWPAR